VDEEQKDHKPCCDPKAQVMMLSILGEPLEMGVPKEFGDRHENYIEYRHLL
jgi:hypothetical protein